jgi:hypothetical protein
MFTKKLLLTIAIFIFVFSINAQEWAPPGATWYYSVDGFGMEGHLMIEAIGDTNINGQDYRVLAKTQHTYNHISGNYFHGEIGREYTYYQDEKVYLLRNNVQYVLYDFGAQAGGEWTIPHTYGTDTICDSTGTVRCDIADTTTLNGFLLKVYIVNPSEGSFWSLGNNAELHQYIGNTSDYFLPNITEECPIADLGEGGTFRCYHDDILGWYTKVPVGECDMITGLVEPEEVIGIEIFPNPCSDVLKIRYRMPDTRYQMPFTRHASRVTCIDLYAIDGRMIRELIHREVKPGDYEMEIDVSHLPAGIYFIKTQVGDYLSVNKLVIN